MNLLRILCPANVSDAATLTYLYKCKRPKGVQGDPPLILWTIGAAWGLTSLIPPPTATTQFDKDHDR